MKEKYNTKTINRSRRLSSHQSYKMRLVYLCSVLALVGQTTALVTTSSTVFAQGPIIDNDPAPGRSPGPPVNYQPLSFTSPSSSSATELTKKNPLKDVLSTAPPHPPSSTLSSFEHSRLHSTVLGNYKDESTLSPPTTTDTETPATSTVDEQQWNNSTTHDKDNEGSGRRGDVAVKEDKQKPLQNLNNHEEITTKAITGRIEQAEEITQNGTKANTEVTEEKRKDTLNYSTTPLAIINDATEDSLPRRRTTITIEKNLTESKTKNRNNIPNPEVTSAGNVLMVSPRSRRSNRVTTTSPSMGLIERIPVVTVKSKSALALHLKDDEEDEWDRVGEVNLFCGDSVVERKQRERSYSSEPDDVLIMLPGRDLSGDHSEVAEGGDSVTVITTREDVTTTASSVSLGNESLVGNRKVFANVSDLYQSTSQSPSVEDTSSTQGMSGIATESGSDSKSAVHQKAAEERRGVPAPEEITRDHKGVPVLVDVTHDAFESRFGLVAGIEYRGECYLGAERVG